MIFITLSSLLWMQFIILVNAAKMTNLRSTNVFIKPYKRDSSHNQRLKSKFSVSTTSNDIEALEAFSEVGHEIYYYLKNYFYKGRFITDKEWETIRLDLMKISDRRELIIENWLLEQKQPKVKNVLVLENIRSSMQNVFRRLWKESNSDVPNLYSSQFITKIGASDSEEINRILSQLNDKYAIHLPYNKMNKYSNKVRGKSGITGIKIRKFSDFVNAPFMIRLLISDCSHFIKNIISEIFPNTIRKRIAKNETISIDSSQEDSRVETLGRLKSYIVKCSVTFGSLVAILSVLIDKVYNYPIYHKYAPLWFYAGITASILSIPLLLSPFVYSIRVVGIDETSLDSSKISIGDRIVSVDGDYINHSLSTKRIQSIISGLETHVDDSDVCHIGVIKKKHSDQKYDNSSTRLPFSSFKEIHVNKKIIESSSVSSKHLNSSLGIGYVKIDHFSDTTFDQVVASLNTLSSIKPLKGLVLDLRGNRGGLLGAAVDIAGIFLPKNKIVTQIVQAGQPIESPTTRSRYFLRELCDNVKEKVKTTQMIVLANAETASASEILISALKYHKRAKIAGAHTYGKNIAQVIVPLGDGSGLLFTAMEFRSPSGTSLEGGIQPDILLTYPNAPFEQVSYDPITKEWKVRYSSVKSH